MEINVEIHLMWIPAHVGIELHDKADRLARHEARNIHLEISPAPAFITFDNALNLSKDIAMKSWQQKWEREATGQLTIDSSYHKLVQRPCFRIVVRLEFHIVEYC